MTNYLLLILLPLALGLLAQWRVKSAFGKYSVIRASSNISGADAARQVLAAEQIRDVDVVEIDSMLGDHYDPSTKRLCLSSAVYHEPSVAALGIAAHEAGHAIQHARHYGPLRARMALVPITMYASKALPFIMMGGFFFQMAGLLKLGIICYLVLGVFQLITLPVEFDASARAKVVLRQMGLVSAGDEATGVNRVLDAAAWTYVAAFVAVLGNLLYLIMATQGRRD